MSNHQLAGRLRLRVLAAACAVCLCVACAAAPLAHAAETVTRSLAGINFTLPADWEEVQVTEGVDVETGVANIQAYHKNDGLFIAGTLPDASLASGTMDDLEAAAALVEIYLDDTPFSTISCSAQKEQGVPTLTFYTDDLGLNNVQYAMTAKLFVVDTPEFAGGVVMMSLLPASGQVSDNLDDLFMMLDEATRVEVAGISYEVPAGCMALDGYAFGIEFGVAICEDGAVFLTDVPDLADDGSVTVEDLQYAADQIMDSYNLEFDVDGTVEDVWSGAYSFLGFPTLGMELTAAAEDAPNDLVYVACTASVTPVGLSFLMVVQPIDSPFAETLLGSAEATVEPLTAPGSALPTAETAAEATNPGFSVGF